MTEIESLRLRNCPWCGKSHWQQDQMNRHDAPHKSYVMFCDTDGCGYQTEAFKTTAELHAALAALRERGEAVALQRYTQQIVPAHGMKPPWIAKMNPDPKGAWVDYFDVARNAAPPADARQEESR